MKRIPLIIIYLLVNHFVNAQNSSIKSQNIYGTWKCVRMDIRGMQDYGLDKAMIVKKAILEIDKSEIVYHGASFIKPCNYVKWQINRFDTSYYHGIPLERDYLKSELVKILDFVPVDAKANPACINNCSEYLLKGDTLVNICGGYSYYRVKINASKKDKMKSFNRNSG